MSFSLNRTVLPLFVLLAACCAGTSGVVALIGQSQTISQKNRLFNPNDVTLAMGQPLVVVNDDEDLLHHAYVESEEFSFDSGDQEPGSRTTITFPVRGEFKILCGIHPKMKLSVHVK